MKNTILALALISVSAMSSAFACSSPEAQFIGKVADYAADCTYIIDVTSYQPSGVCPLSIDEVYGSRFEDKSCSLKNGDMVSGYLIVKDERVVIE